MIEKRAAVLAAMAIAALGAPPALAQDTGWGMIGQRVVTPDADHDTIEARGGEQFHEIMFCVERAPISFQDVSIRFRNGTAQSVRLRTRVADARCSRGVALRGRERDIAGVDFTYQAARPGGASALVQLFAR